MYLKFNEIHLIDADLAAQRGVTDADTVPLYERDHGGERILTLDGEHDDTPRYYGLLYQSADGILCVIPDVWSESDALSAASHDHSRYYS